MKDSGRRVLIVEDDVEIASSMAELLRDEAYEVSCAANGCEALAVLRAAALLPDLILLDLMMPEMDGYQFRKDQLGDPRLAGIPVLLMSASGNIQAKATELGAHGYLRKPFKDVDTILDTVGRFV